MSKIVDRPAAAGSAEWRKIITASKIPVILGLSPWQTPGDLWMEMSGYAEPEHLEGDHLDWGHIAEDSLAAWWVHQNQGWQISRGEVAYTDPELPFPNQVLLDRRARRGRRFHIVECKTSNSTRTWGDDSDIPGNVTAQLLAQMGVSGIHEASVVVQLGSTVPRIHEVEWDPEVWSKIVDHVEDFYRSLGESVPPVPSHDLLEALTPRPAPSGDSTEADPELVEAWQTARRAVEDAKTELSRAEEKLVEQSPDAKALTINGTKFLSWQAGRFSERRIPRDAAHLLKDPEVCSTVTRLDAKKLQAKYPEVYAAGVGDPTPRFNMKALEGADQ